LIVIVISVLYNVWILYGLWMFDLNKASAILKSHAINSERFNARHIQALLLFALLILFIKLNRKTLSTVFTQFQYNYNGIFSIYIFFWRHRYNNNLLKYCIRLQKIISVIAVLETIYTILTLNILIGRMRPNFMTLRVQFLIQYNIF